MGGVLLYFASLLVNILLAKVACNLIQIPMEGTQINDLVKGHHHCEAAHVGSVMFQIHQVRIRGGLELTPLAIELALGLTHTITCGVDALTPTQFAIVVGH